MNKEILVIDDNPDIRLLVSNILKEQTFLVRTAANYDQAEFEINKKLPDLAIIDIKLDKPDKDGIDLLKIIMKKNKQIPVIMISGHATVKIAIEAIRIGAYEFIEKPFSKEKIFPPTFSQLISVGEQTGSLDSMLTSVAKYYEEEFDTAVSNLSSLIEPIMIVFMGATIGGLMIALYSPIFNVGAIIN